MGGGDDAQGGGDRTLQATLGLSGRVVMIVQH
jgi:hypothetical protein